MALTSPSGEDRALAMGLLGFVAMIVIAALLYTLFNPAIDEIFRFSSEQATTTQGQDAIDLREEIWGYVLIYCVFLSSVYMIARSVFESRRLG